MTAMHRMNCGACGIEFDVPEHFYEDRYKTGKGWFCPNGHSRVFKESAVDLMRRERDRALQQVARAEQEAAANLRAYERVQKETKKLKRRAATGVCPCCTRTVGQLARHMKTKHPEFVAAEVTNVVPIKKKA